ncbi:MAG: chorismate lyase [Natronospirillum sp.]|uniref:chorismate--pyruvate lyase family protein n=1 Tax=Natronospirillum sp. TaxID=2812955 RepID=UPI0025DA1476|nr:chorismate lyase [Natronospirillum sp.]MCH8551590.1 chorismate lyase [Natronospirillum sp.]
MTDTARILQDWPIRCARIDWQAAPPDNGVARDWLTDTGSLTAKLLSLSGGDFRVDVLREGRFFGAVGRPVPQPSVARGAGHGLYWQREVLLCGRNEGWVRALTLVPVRHQALIRRLRRLGRQPLGAFLFAQAELQRVTMDFATLDWGLARRSWFRLGTQEIILIEVFLDDFLVTVQ